jgi:hypothetical protein
MSHPSLGLPPRHLNAGFPAAAARIRGAADRIAARALEIAIDRDPTLRERYDEIGLRQLVRDARGYVERVALAVAANDPAITAEWADWVAPVYRRRRVPMDDLIGLSEAIRQQLLTVLSPAERPPADAALDAAIRVFRWYRRLAGDARKRNRILQFIYKGA